MKTLEDIRKKRGISRYKMAKMLGISQTSYDYLEQKAQGMSFDLQDKIITALGLTPEEWRAMIHIEANRRPRGKRKKE